MTTAGRAMDWVDPERRFMVILAAIGCSRRFV